MYKQNYYIRGKHAEYMRHLVSSSEGQTLGRSSNVFDYGYEVLFIAPLIGVAFDLKGEVEKHDGMDFTVNATQMIKYNDKIINVYQLVLLADRSLKLTADERVDFVFRPSEKDRKLGYDLFDCYLRGGIEWLYKNIVEKSNSSSDDNVLNNIISSINTFTTENAIYQDMGEKIKETEEIYFKI